MSSQDQDVWETVRKYRESATQVEQQLKQWCRDISRLESAEEAHQDERRRLESQLLEASHSVASENPEHQAQYSEAFNRVVRCGMAVHEAAQKQQEHRQRVRDLLDRFPLAGSLSPEGAFITSSHSLCTTSPLGEDGRNQPLSDEPMQGVEETSAPVSPPCREALPPVPMGDGDDMAALPNLEQHGDESEAAGEAEGSPDERGTSITVAGDGTADDESRATRDARQALVSGQTRRPYILYHFSGF